MGFEGVSIKKNRESEDPLPTGDTPIHIGYYRSNEPVSSILFYDKLKNQTMATYKRNK